MSWVKQYKRKESAAKNLLRRIEKKKNMRELTQSKTENKQNNNIQIPPEKNFVLKSGEMISSIKDLAIIIDCMDNNVFKHHVNEERNDFSTWINDVFQEKSLAESLLGIYDRKECQLTLLKHAIKRVH